MVLFVPVCNSLLYPFNAVLIEESCPPEEEEDFA